MSIINDALKKVQAKLEQKGSKMEKSSNEKDPSTKTSETNMSQSESGQDNTIPQPKEVSPPEEQSDFLKKNLQFIQKSKSESAPETEILEERTEKKVQFLNAEKGGSKLVQFIKGFMTIVVCLFVIAGSIFYLFQKMEWGSQTRKIERTMKKQMQVIKKSIPEVTEKIKDVQSKIKVPSVPPAQPTAVAPVTAVPKAEVKKPIQRSSEASKLSLNGVVRIEDRKVALINNEIREVGDIIEGYKLIRVSSREVELEGFGETVILKVKK